MVASIFAGAPGTPGFPGVPGVSGIYVPGNTYCFMISFDDNEVKYYFTKRYLAFEKVTSSILFCYRNKTTFSM